MKFTKMHGLGNDFIIIDEQTKGKWDYSAIAARVCKRRLSVGADGLLVVCPSQSADIRMRILNADGSEANMCGNGIRCFAKYVYERGIVQKTKMEIETLAGIMKPRLFLDQSGRVDRVRVDMGKPDFDHFYHPAKNGEPGGLLNERVNIAGYEIDIASMLMGVPHTMVFVDSIEGTDISAIGPALEKHEKFPGHTNVNFVEYVDSRTIKVKTWERGVGFTLACGTGSCASAVATHLRGRTGNEVTVKLEAGELFIEYTNDGRVFMTGPAERVFEGEILI